MYQEEQETAHECFFQRASEVISKEVLNDQKVLKLTDLVQLYISALERTDFPNVNYRREKLKARLEKRYGKQITFCKFNTKCRLLLVYSAILKLKTAVQNACL